MSIGRRIALAAIALALSVTFVAAGLLACLLPPVTHALSGAFAMDDVSPFSKDQLAQVADATREFSFGANDELALQQTIYAVNLDLQEQTRAVGLSLPTNAPELSTVTDVGDLDQLRAVFAQSSEAYCFSANAVSHLDDCHAVLSAATPVLAGCAVVAAAGLAFVAKAWGRRCVCVVLVASGVTVVALFALLGLWAVIDFDGLFTTFHRLFFSQGNWQFPYNSLLICALPTEFWMGMGGTWLGTTLLVSVASVIVGRVVVRRR